MNTKRFIKGIIATLLSSVMIINMTGCAETIKAADLMEDITKEQVEGKDADNTFIKAQMDFSMKIFKNTVAASEKDNILVSPLSVMLALSMTANGAVGDTKTEMQDVLSGGITIEELNKYNYSYVNGLPSNEKTKLNIANSIWVRDDLDVEKDFLQTNANYYDAAAYMTKFDDKALEDINNWVKENTDEMIDKIMDEHTDDAVMYLINAITFDSEWQTKYMSYEVYDGKFNSYNNEKNEVKMMSSTEYTYLEDENATGFVKPYKNNAYSFVGLLPNEDIDILEYVEEFTYDKYKNIMDNAKSCSVKVDIPKFSYDYDLNMNEILKSMGMEKSFDGRYADFSKLGHSQNGNIYIGNVIHKTFIEVDENGTRAAAVTKVDMVEESAMIIDKSVKLDRPFVYMIIDNATNIPIFMGVAMDI